MTIALIVFDLVTLLLSCLLYGTAALATYQLICWADTFLETWLLVALWPVWVVVFTLSLIALLFVVRLVSPKVRPGKHLAPNSPGFWIWTWKFSLRRLTAIVPLSTIIHWSAILRWLNYRALGMKLAFESSMSSDVIIIDPEMTSIGRKCVIGGRTLLGCHYTNKYPDGDKLIIAPIRIGENVNIGMDCVLGPGTEIEDGAQIGTSSILSVAVKVGKGANIKPFSTIPPKTVIPAGSVYPAEEN